MSTLLKNIKNLAMLSVLVASAVSPDALAQTQQKPVADLDRKTESWSYQGQAVSGPLEGKKVSLVIRGPIKGMKGSHYAFLLADGGTEAPRVDIFRLDPVENKGSYFWQALPLSPYNKLEEREMALEVAENPSHVLVGENKLPFTDWNPFKSCTYRDQLARSFKLVRASNLIQGVSLSGIGQNSEFVFTGDCSQETVLDIKPGVYSVKGGRWLGRTNISGKFSTSSKSDRDRSVTFALPGDSAHRLLNGTYNLREVRPSIYTLTQEQFTGQGVFQSPLASKVVIFIRKSSWLCPGNRVCDKNHIAIVDLHNPSQVVVLDLSLIQ